MCEKEGVSVWLDHHDLIAGPLQEQIDRAIRLQDVVLLVLSEASVESDWVEHELEVAREKEKTEKRDVLCPVALDETWKAKMIPPIPTKTPHPRARAVAPRGIKFPIRSVSISQLGLSDKELYAAGFLTRRRRQSPQQDGSDSPVL